MIAAAYADPGVHETNVRLGIEEPLPEFSTIVQEARYWRVSPMEILEWPLEWITNGRIVREAEAIAQQRMSKAR